MFLLAIALQIHASCFRDLKSRDRAPVSHASTEADTDLYTNTALFIMFMKPKEIKSLMSVPNHKQTQK